MNGGTNGSPLADRLRDMGVDLTIIGTRKPKYKRGAIVKIRKTARQSRYQWAYLGEIEQVRDHIDVYPNGESFAYFVAWYRRAHPSDPAQPRKFIFADWRTERDIFLETENENELAAAEYMATAQLKLEV